MPWIDCVSWSSDGSQVAIGDNEGRIEVSTPGSTTPPRTWRDPSGEVDAVAFLPDGRLAAAGKDAEVRLWDSTGTTVGTLSWGEYGLPDWDGGITSLAVSPDGKHLAAGGWDHTARIWNLETGQQERVLKGHGAAVRTVAWSADGTLLATGSNDGSAAVWTASTGSPVAVLRAKTIVVAVAFSPDGKRLAVGSDTLSIFNDDLGWPSRSDGSGPDALLHPAPGASSLSMWRTSDWTFAWNALVADEVVELEFGPAGELYTGVFENGQGHRVLAVDPKKGKVLRRIEVGEGTLLDLDLSPDGTRLAAGRTAGMTVVSAK